MGEKDNFTYKNISEFTPEDTIYIQGGSSQFPVSWLCQFIKFEKGIAHGIKISTSVNPTCYTREVGEEISARLDKCYLFGKSKPDDKWSHANWFDVLGFAGYELKEQPYDAKVPDEHPSYCVVGLSRTNSNGGRPFFGASVKPNSYVSLKIKKARIERNLNSDWINGGETLIEVHLTEAQFAEAITSLNMGSGTPATLFQIGGHRIPEPPFMGKVEQHSKEFANTMSDLASKLDLNLEKAKAIINSDKPISKKERDALTGIIASVMQEIKSNIPFYEQQFVEQMDKTIHEAKMQIDQHLTQKATALGIPMVRQEDILSIEENGTNKLNE